MSLILISQNLFTLVHFQQMVIDAALLDEKSYHEAVSMVLTGVVVSRNRTKIVS